MKNEKVWLKCKACGQIFTDDIQHGCSTKGLKAENIRLRSALEFYANAANWARINFNVNGEKSVCRFTVTGDAGEIASKALNGGESDD